MLGIRSDRHCSDGILLTYADGELRGKAANAVSQHCASCWECRARLGELEQQAEALALAVAQEGKIDSAKAGEAKAAFLAWKDRFEESRRSVQPRRPRFRILPYAAAAVCVAGILLLAVAPRILRHPASLSAADVLSRIERSERDLVSVTGALHQVIRVEVVQTKPRVERWSTGRVEIWADRASGCYASRWTDEGNVLRYASWRSPSGAAAYPLADPPGPSVPELGLAGERLSLEAIERAFVRWVRANQWRQVSLAHEMAVLSSRAAVMVRADTDVLPDGSRVLRVTATRESRSIRLEYVIEVSAGSYRTTLETVRFESGGRQIELRMVPERVAVVKRSSLNPQLFLPDLPKSAQSAPSAVPGSAGSAPIRGTLNAGLDSASVEALYALHLSRACLDEKAEIAGADPGGLRVRAIVRTEQRRAELLHTLARVASSAKLITDIQVVPSPGPGPVRRNPLLHRDALQALDNAYLDGFALVRLAEDFGTDRLARLTPESRRLVGIMVRDHVAAIRAGLRTVAQSAGPTLSQLAGNSASAGSASLIPVGEWTAMVFELFRAMDRADELIDPAATAQKAAAADLLRLLGGLEERARLLDVAVTKEFSGHTENESHGQVEVRQ